MDEYDIPILNQRTYVKDAGMGPRNSGWVCVTSSRVLGLQRRTALISRGAIDHALAQDPDGTMTLADMLRKDMATRVISTGARTVALADLLNGPASDPRKSVIITGKTTTMPRACRRCNRRHGPGPCPNRP